MRNSEKTGVICCTYLTIWMHEVMKSLSDETMRTTYLSLHTPFVLITDNSKIRVIFFCSQMRFAIV